MGLGDFVTEGDKDKDGEPESEDDTVELVLLICDRDTL